MHIPVPHTIPNKPCYSDAAETLPHLEALLSTLTTQHHGFASPSPPAAADSNPSPTPRASKNVRFSDTPASPSEELFGRYRDDPANESEGYRDAAAHMDNQQVYDYHNQIMDEQDEHLDRLGESIGRQRELSMQIGDELDSHVAMLDEVDGVVDRHQSRLDRAKKTLGKVTRAAGQNMQMTTIIALIIILVLLIAILK